MARRHATAQAKNAAIYVRISSDPTGQQLGVERQEDDCRRLCEQSGWPVADVYRDNDISASAKVPRPAYDRMMRAVEAREIQVIVAYAVDRLYRRIADLEELINIAERYKVDIATVASGDLNLSTADGRMTARILTSVAQKESERSGERIARKHDQLAAAGRPAGQMRSFGYDADGAVNKKEAKVIRQLASRFIAGESLHSLTDWLNDSRVPSARGNVGKWRISTVRALLASAKISGQRERTRKSKHLKDEKPAFGEIVGDAVWDAIITPDETETIRLILGDPTRRTSRPGQYLLSGVLRCEKCGNTMLARSDDDQSGRRYACIKAPGTTRCGKTSIVGAKTDAFVLKAVAQALNDASKSPVQPVGDSQEVEQARRDRDAATARLKAAGAQWGAGDLPDDAWAAIQAAVKVKVAECDAIIAAGGKRVTRRRTLMTGAEFLEQVPSMSTSAVRAIVKDVCADISVGPATKGQNSFDSSRISVTLRQ